MRLDMYDNRSFSRGRSLPFEILWLVAQSLFVRSQMPGSAHRRWLLRLFGARVGKGVMIKPGVRIKFPWHLTIGDHSWIGEDVWIDNLTTVVIGSHCCISQSAYICTGNHDWSTAGFDLRTQPVKVADMAWIAARSIVAPGVTLHEGSVLALGSVATRDLEAWTVNSGNPASKISARSKRPRLIAIERL